MYLNYKRVINFSDILHSPNFVPLLFCFLGICDATEIRSNTVKSLQLLSHNYIRTIMPIMIYHDTRFLHSPTKKSITVV